MHEEGCHLPTAVFIYRYYAKANDATRVYFSRTDKIQVIDYKVLYRCTNYAVFPPTLDSTVYLLQTFSSFNQLVSRPITCMIQLLGTILTCPCVFSVYFLSANCHKFILSACGHVIWSTGLIYFHHSKKKKKKSYGPSLDRTQAFLYVLCSLCFVRGQTGHQVFYTLFHRCFHTPCFILGVFTCTPVSLGFHTHFTRCFDTLCFHFSFTITGFRCSRSPTGHPHNRIIYIYKCILIKKKKKKEQVHPQMGRYSVQLYMFVFKCFVHRQTGPQVFLHLSLYQVFSHPFSQVFSHPFSQVFSHPLSLGVFNTRCHQMFSHPCFTWCLHTPCSLGVFTPCFFTQVFSHSFSFAITSQVLTDGTHAHDGIHGKKGRHSAQVYMCTGVLSVVGQDTHVRLSVIRRHASFLCVPSFTWLLCVQEFCPSLTRSRVFFLFNVLRVLDINTCYANVCQ